MFQKHLNPPISSKVIEIRLAEGGDQVTDFAVTELKTMGMAEVWKTRERSSFI